MSGGDSAPSPELDDTETLRLVARAGYALARSLDYEVTLDNVTGVFVPEICDWCAVHCLDESGEPTLERLGGTHDARERALDLVEHELVTRVLKCNEPVLTDAALVVPLMGSYEVLGTLTLGWRLGRRPVEPVEVSRITELGRLAGQALENARLYSREREARRLAVQSASRTLELQRVTADLTGALTVEEVVATIIRSARLAPDTVGGFVALLDERKAALRIVRAHGYAEEIVEKWRSFPVDANVPAALAVRREKPVFVGSPQELVERFGIQPSLGLSWAAVPLIVDSGVIGVLAASYSVRRSFSDADQLELLALAGQCAQALERARLYEAERRSRLFLAEAEHIARLGSWEYDVAEDRVTWSDQLWRIFGLEPHSQSLCFNSYADRIHPNDLEAEQRKLDALAREGTEDAFMHRIITDAGEVRWIRGVRRVKRDSNNNVTSLFGYAQDVSEQQALQEQLLQAQKMEAVGQLAGGIAHDFNNLLTAILSYSDLLQAELENSDPKWADVEEIRKAALRASTLTRQLLAFSRRQILRSSAFNLNSVLMDMQPMLGRLIGEDIVLSLSLQDDLPKIVADRSQVEQVIMNLVVNSRDAMPDGGAIVLATEYHTGPQATLLVRDTGTGMDEATRSRIFEPFFTTKELGKGTGLGMSTVQGIIQQSGGDIDVVSAPGKGTTVRVSLPLATEVDGERGIVKENADGHEGDETILLVEDEERVRNATSRILQAHGYTVLIATNAAEAIQLLDYDASQVDLVLTDVVLPGMSGIELASVLAERKIDLPVVLVSGYAEEELNRRSGGFAMTDVLNKPYSREELLARIRLALDARQEG